MRPEAQDPAGTGSGSALHARLRHVYWIGGGSGAGKSAVAKRIAARHGLRVYSTDDAMPDHAARSMPGDAPHLSRFKQMDMDERWVNRSPKVMFDTFHWYQGEGFGLIVEDLLDLSAQTGVIAEGFRLLPHLVKPLLAKPAHAVWLVPTPEFREAVFVRRGWQIPRATSDPERARFNLLERDRMFTEHIAEQVEHLGLRALEVDTSMREDELVEQAAVALGFGSR